LRVGDVPVAPVKLPAGPCVIGFRPEWAAIGEAGIPVTVQSSRVLGTEAGVAVGLVAAELGRHSIYTHQALDRPPSGAAKLELDAERLVVFREQRRLDIEIRQ
jgi:hypothetical protein